MPNKRGVFTPKERLFVKRYAETGDASYAATKAGFKSVSSSASQHLANPAIQAEIFAEQRRLLRTEVLPLAVKRHLAVLADPKVTGQSLNRAIELAYKYGMAEGDAGQTKQPHEMTAEELGRAIETLKRAASDQAKPVIDLEAEPPPSSSVFD